MFARPGTIVLLLAFLLGLFLAPEVRAQGGPPMITDDPGTPGDGKWEINLFLALERRPSESSYELPGVDINYGIGEHVELTLELTAVLLKHKDAGVVGGLGGTEAAVKWRFLDEDKNGFDLSMLPEVSFTALQSSVRRGLAEDGTGFQIPFQAAKSFGRLHVGAEFGPRTGTFGRSEWLYGIIGGFDVTQATTLMAELHGTSRTSFSHDALTVNVGLHHDFTETRALILSVGHEIRDPDESVALIAYLGVQLLY